MSYNCVKDKNLSIIIFVLGEFMSSIGIIKEFDKLGRIVIPKDLRERYGLKNTVEIVATKERILLKSQEYRLERKNTDNNNS